jgi:tetratricopeptide (TPR) repeat protein
MTILAELCSVLGEKERAAILYPRLLPYARRNVFVAPGAGCYGSVSRYLGMLATCLEDWTAAADHLERAIELNQLLGSPPLVAHTRYEYALMLARRGDAGDAKRSEELLRLASETAQQLGMGMLLRKLETARAAAGSRE